MSINSSLNDRISAFAKAGTQISQYLEGTLQDHSSEATPWEQRISESLILAERKNTWFTQDNLRHALTQWSQALQKDRLEKWVADYPIKTTTTKTVAIIAAGNLPLVGFHDILCVILTGHHALIKRSTKDDVLSLLLLEMVVAADPALKDSFSFAQGKLEHYDAVIATGSDNTARYFEHYFGSKPHIIRKNRNSIAVLTGKESLEQMKALSEDVFRYFGLGCRSVSHIKVPKGFNFDLFFNGMYEQRHLINNEKYLNNYDYNKAVYLMSEFELLDNEFLLIKEENDSYTSPIASLGYSYYETSDDLSKELQEHAEALQCIVTEGAIQDRLTADLKDFAAPSIVAFGTTQQPALNDYADGVDTLEFLLTLS